MSRKWLAPLAAAFTAVLCWAALWVIWSNRPELAFAQDTGKAEQRQPIILDKPPVRIITDPYATFNGIVVDEEKGEVFLGSDNKYLGESIQVYRTEFPPTDRIMEPLRRIAGPKANLGLVCALGISPQHKELYFVNNDSVDNMGVFSLDANGNVSPTRELNVPHGAWGVFFERKFDELFITVEHVNKMSVYLRTAQGDDDPMRVIQGPSTELADPHGIYVDVENNEIYITNHGHWRRTRFGEGYNIKGDSKLARLRGNEGPYPGTPDPLAPSTGKFVPSAITVYPRSGNGDVAPVRMIQGPKTRLNLPLGILLDTASNQLVVANGDDSVLFFDRNASGDVAPARILQGPATQLKDPTGVSIDSKRDELWVTNWGEHSATVYPRTAQGNVAPLRVIRGAPKGSSATGLGSPGAVAYNPKRQEILAPN